MKSDRLLRVLALKDVVDALVAQGPVVADSSCALVRALFPDVHGSAHVYYRHAADFLQKTGNLDIDADGNVRITREIEAHIAVREVERLLDGGVA